MSVSNVVKYKAALAMALSLTYSTSVFAMEANDQKTFKFLKNVSVMRGGKSFKLLLSVSFEGYQKAQSYINDALYNGKIGQDNRDRNERFNELKDRELKGDQKAREYVSDAIFY